MIHPKTYLGKAVLGSFLVILLVEKCLSEGREGWVLMEERIMVDYLSTNSYLQGKAEIVFLLDRSGSVGAANFEIERGFVESFLTHIVVDVNATRVSVISYSDTATRHIDYLSQPKTKCFLAHELQEIGYENSGATNIVAALEEAKLVFEKARPNVNKVIVLISDGLATRGGDPVPVAADLKAKGVQIFCFGVGRFLRPELEKLASSIQNVYTCSEFREFKRLARSIRGDPHETSWSGQASNPNCDHLCDSLYKGSPDDPGCCDHDARCSCALLSGMHTCACNPGYYGLSGLAGNCKACPRGTYKSKLEPASSCTRCPPSSTTAEVASTKLSDCYCMEGYFGDPAKEIPCTKIKCPALQEPVNGAIYGSCDNIYGSTCHFMCNDGYELVDPDSDVRSCRSNGEWSGTTTVCKVMECSRLMKPKYGIITCDSEKLTVGKRCKFECDSGYVHEGSHMRECLPDKKWSGFVTKCIPIECQLPPRILHGYHTCSTKRKTVLHETCAYRCNGGFRLEGPQFLTCRENGKLSDNYKRTEHPRCVDIQRPELKCPKSMKVKSDKGQNRALISWIEPIPTDNSGYTPKLITSPPNIRSPHYFYIGVTDFQYIAIDNSEHKTSCYVRVEVVDEEDPMVMKCPERKIIGTNDAGTTVYWEEPEFWDNSGKNLLIYKTASSGDYFYQGTQVVTYVAYDGSRNSAVCEFEVIVTRTQCTYYPPPVNGALACNDWMTGHMCRVYCNEKYDFVSKPAFWYICDQRAKWSTIPAFMPIPWPSCAKPSIPGKVRQLTAFHYTGDCNDLQVQRFIQKMFMREFMHHIQHTDLCNGKGNCRLENVKVMCGEIRDDFNKRKKRDVWDHAATHKLELEFEITIDADLQLNDTDTIFLDFLKTIQNLNFDFDENSVQYTTLAYSEEENSVQHTTLAYSEEENSFRKQSSLLVVSEKETTIICNPGSVLQDEICVLCPPGTRYNNVIQNCEDCPRGYFQEDEGQEECIKCPDGRNTESARSINETECKAVCSAGSYSSTGLETCVACPVGTYQELKGEDACINCPNVTTTETVGTSSKAECREMCSPGTYSETGLLPCYSCPLNYYQPLYGQRECSECPEELSTLKNGTTDLIECFDLDPCTEEMPCLNGGNCTRFGRNAFCECLDGFEGNKCEHDVDECKESPCLNEGYCINTNGSFYCQCASGFAGTLCEVEMDECLFLPCRNNGTCLDRINGYICVCPDGYEGLNCEIERTICGQDVICLNGLCVAEGSNSSCVCDVGYSGVDCSVNEDDCVEVSCGNNGKCIDDVASFTCSCKAGYTGKYCETDIDDCENNLCHEGSTCQDEIDSYKCICGPGWGGTYCENKMDSDFVLMFPESTATVANKARATLNSPLSDATVSMWVQTQDVERSGTPISYAVARRNTIDGGGNILDNALTISDCSSVKVYVNNEVVSTDLQAADGRWHHLAFTWSSNNNGKWAIYKDGKLHSEGMHLRSNDAIPDGGSLVIGQEQDTVGGGFSPVETFTGNITRVNIWNSFFSQTNISQLCNMDDDLPDKVVAWPDFLKGVEGEVQVLPKENPILNSRDITSNEV